MSSHHILRRFQVRRLARSNFHSSIPISEKTKFFVSPEKPISDAGETHNNNKQISDAADEICRILSTKPSHLIEPSLNEASIQLSPQLVAESLKKLTNAGMLALAFYRWAEKQPGFTPTTEIFHHLIEALGKIKQFRLIWAIVDSMRHRSLLTRDTFAMIIRRYARARNVREAVNTFEKMSAFGLRPELADCNSLIDTLCKSKQVKKAHEVFDEMKKRKRFAPDVKTYTILLEGWGRERNMAMMDSLCREMTDVGLQPDVVTYGILINAFCKAGKCDDGVRIFREMEANNCKPGPHIYCTLIKGLGAENRLDEAVEYFEMSKASGFAPETPTYNAVVGAYCSSSRFDEASRVVEEMRRLGVGPNTRTYDVILHHLIKAGKTEDAYQLFQRMSREPGCEPEINTYTMMVSMFCTVERVDMALKVWRQMNEKGVLPCMHMFSSLINGLCHENRLEEACSYFQEMLDKGIRPPGQLFSNLKEALLDGGKNHLALEMGTKLDTLRKIPLNG